MLNHELSAQFADSLPKAKVFVVNPSVDETDHEKLAISKVTFLMGSDPEDTIIETSRTDSTIDAESLVLALAEFSPDGIAQLFIRDEDGDYYAYYDIAEVRHGPYHHSLIVGAFRAGGG